MQGLSTNEAPKGSKARSRSRLSEYAQVAGLFDSYARGDAAARLLLSGMEPPFKRISQSGMSGLHVWEARLAFVRVFGWCVEPGVWVAVQGDWADEIKRRPRHTLRSYEARARSTARWRRVAGFTASDVWTGQDLNAFLVPPAKSPIDH